ncbi:hypothetical protein ACRALDRAFT_206575 [Sodiomyces alcalophilus JCM 7366]|uniref:uncharacterized protein n=1 Tax=Sodiomyces alcalophilus JCM 7366 TaxID=591952 RepID=UPI0039B5ED26
MYVEIDNGDRISVERTPVGGPTCNCGIFLCQTEIFCLAVLDSSSQKFPESTAMEAVGILPITMSFQKEARSATGKEKLMMYDSYEKFHFLFEVPSHYNVLTDLRFQVSVGDKTLSVPTSGINTLVLLRIDEKERKKHPKSTLYLPMCKRTGIVVDDDCPMDLLNDRMSSMLFHSSLSPRESHVKTTTKYRTAYCSAIRAPFGSWRNRAPTWDRCSLVRYSPRYLRYSCTVLVYNVRTSSHQTTKKRRLSLVGLQDRHSALLHLCHVIQLRLPTSQNGETRLPISTSYCPWAHQFSSISSLIDDQVGAGHASFLTLYWIEYSKFQIPMPFLIHFGGHVTPGTFPIRLSSVAAPFRQQPKHATLHVFPLQRLCGPSSPMSSLAHVPLATHCRPKSAPDPIADIDGHGCMPSSVSGKTRWTYANEISNLISPGLVTRPIRQVSGPRANRTWQCIRRIQILGSLYQVVGDDGVAISGTLTLFIAVFRRRYYSAVRGKLFPLPAASITRGVAWSDEDVTALKVLREFHQNGHSPTTSAAGAWAEDSQRKLEQQQSGICNAAIDRETTDSSAILYKWSAEILTLRDQAQAEKVKM